MLLLLLLLLLMLRHRHSSERWRLQGDRLVVPEHGLHRDSSDGHSVGHLEAALVVDSRTLGMVGTLRDGGCLHGDRCCRALHGAGLVRDAREVVAPVLPSQLNGVASLSVHIPRCAGVTLIGAGVL